MKISEKCSKGCLFCSGDEAIEKAKSSIKTIGIVVIPILNTEIVYCVGISSGRKGGLELITTGIGVAASNSVFRTIKHNVDQILSQLSKPGNSICSIINDGMIYTNQKGIAVRGPIILIKITEENRKSYCIMHRKIYGHDDFVTYQVLICDAKGRHFLDPDYDKVLFKSQFPLFDI